jgi:hypothetical protein
MNMKINSTPRLEPKAYRQFLPFAPRVGQWSDVVSIPVAGRNRKWKINLYQL